MSNRIFGKSSSNWARLERTRNKQPRVPEEKGSRAPLTLDPQKSPCLLASSFCYLFLSLSLSGEFLRSLPSRSDCERILSLSCEDLGEGKKLWWLFFSCFITRNYTPSRRAGSWDPPPDAWQHQAERCGARRVSTRGWDEAREIRSIPRCPPVHAPRQLHSAPPRAGVVPHLRKHRSSSALITATCPCITPSRPP